MNLHEWMGEGVRRDKPFLRSGTMVVKSDDRLHPEATFYIEVLKKYTHKKKLKRYMKI